jgi:hypothetical protein
MIVSEWTSSPMRLVGPSEMDRRFLRSKGVDSSLRSRLTFVKYKLHRPTIGVVNDSDKRVAITVPTEAVLEVVRENPTDGTVEILWDGRSISMFAVDLEARGDVVAREAHKVDSKAASKSNTA